MIRMNREDGLGPWNQKLSAGSRRGGGGPALQASIAFDKDNPSGRPSAVMTLAWSHAPPHHHHHDHHPPLLTTQITCLFIPDYLVNNPLIIDFFTVTFNRFIDNVINKSALVVIVVMDSEWKSRWQIRRGGGGGLGAVGSGGIGHGGGGSGRTRA